MGIGHSKRSRRTRIRRNKGWKAMNERIEKDFHCTTQKKLHSLHFMALRGVRVLEFSGLAPGPHCGMILSDFGADVIRICRSGKSGPFDRAGDLLSRGKRSIKVNIKDSGGCSVIRKLSQSVIHNNGMD